MLPLLSMVLGTSVYILFLYFLYIKYFVTLINESKIGTLHIKYPSMEKILKMRSHITILSSREN